MTSCIGLTLWTSTSNAHCLWCLMIYALVLYNRNCPAHCVELYQSDDLEQCFLLLRRKATETRLGFFVLGLGPVGGMFGKLRKASGGRLSSVSLAAQEAYDGGLINYTVSKQLYRRSKSVKQALSSTLKSARTTPMTTPPLSLSLSLSLSLFPLPSPPTSTIQRVTDKVPKQGNMLMRWRLVLGKSI